VSEASVRALDVALPLMFERVPVVESLPPLSPGMPDVRGMLEPEIRKVKQLLLNLLSNAV
jgi:hypothetical protein